jgi:AraC-like DNA-binding protein
MSADTVARIDVLTTLLEGPRAQNAFLLRSIMEPPWALRIEDEAPLTVVAVIRGHALIVHDELSEDAELRSGDLAVIKGPAPYTVSDAAGSEPQIVIRPGNECLTLSGEPLAETMGLGVRTWGNSPRGSTVMLTGTYEQAGEASRRLLDSIATVVICRDGERRSPLVDVLAAEISRDEPGQSVVLDRLLDLVLIDTIRYWFADHPSQAPPWYRAFSDPTIGTALRLIHGEPAHDWTVASLAAEVGLSRAAFARRFHDTVGEPPMKYLAGWRLALAADLLTDPDATVGLVSAQVGYKSPFTFSTAFKRHFGVSPSDMRVA